MPHSAHFLERLDRVPRSLTDFALELYRDPERVRWIIHYAHLPEAEERVAYIRQANAARRAEGEPEEPVANGEEEVTTNITLSPERIAELAEQEEFLLTVTDVGFGKRTSAYEYRVTGRGGQGIAICRRPPAGYLAGRAGLPPRPRRRLTREARAPKP